jgi:NAD(P)-dependent dehydrogenase (short-subunit alcohol dehydrogenase family)
VKVDRNAKALQAEAGHDVASALDITNPDAATQAVAGAAKTLGGLDGLANSAGSFGPARQPRSPLRQGAP